MSSSLQQGIVMEELSTCEVYPGFLQASERAKELAVCFHERTGIERTLKGWAVLVSPKIQTALDKYEAEKYEYEQECKEYLDWTSNNFSAEDEWKADVLKGIYDDQDSYARSEGDGWFYED